MKRAMALFLVMVFSIGVMLPLTTDWSEASKSKVYKKKRKKIKKYSKAWWKMYRAKKRRARLLAARRRALAKRRAATAAKAHKTPAKTEVAAGRGKSDSEKVAPARPAPVLGKDVPVAAGGSDLEFRVADQNGQQIGSAQLSVIGLAMPQNEDGVPDKARKQMLAGVPVSALRRTVIDRMIKENGWIVNDYQRVVDGKRVFVVVAQSNSSDGATQSRQFYFTEVDGRIYSLSTNAPADYSDKVASDSEKLLRAMSTNNRPVQTADLR